MKTKIFLVLVAMVAVTVSGCGRNSSNDDISSVKKQITELQQQVENLPNDSAKIAEIDKKIDNLQNDEAETEIAELTQKNDELESQLSALQESGGYEVFVDTLFPSDGKTYVINPDYQDDVVIYSDTTCTAKLEKFPEFASSKYIESNAENGLSIHCYRTINNNIVYTTKTIELKEK